MDSSAALDRPPSSPASGGRDAVPFLARRRVLGSGFLLAGVVALGATDVAFPFRPGTSILLMMGGGLLVVFGWLMLAMLGWRYALAAAAGVALSYFVLSAAAPTVSQLSWRMLVSMHREELDTAVRVLQPVAMSGEARSVGPGCTEIPSLPPGDCAALRTALRDVSAHGAWKEGEVTVLETYSSFNARGGLLHCTRDCKPPSPRPYPIYWKRVAGNWYRWAE
jgi:hypothetical protein